ALFAEQRPHPLPLPHRGTFLEPQLRHLRRSPKGCKTGAIPIEVHRIITPFAGSDHASVKIENSLKLEAFEAHLVGRTPGKSNNIARACARAHQLSVPLLSDGCPCPDFSSSSSARSP